MTISELKRETASLLSENPDVESPPGEASCLIEAFLGISRTQMLTHPDTEISDRDASLVITKAEMRKNHVPMAYITGKKEFWGLEFQVNESVLIPRPDTETIVEEALSEIKPGDTVLDLCTGSGAIGISIRASADCD
ncbi:MAG: N5-glutamine methyltransferase family protein, partial [Bullifex sp.]